LLLRVASGDARAFEQLFYTWHHKIGAYVLGWTKSLLVAEEIVQDVFLKIWLNRETLHTIEKFENYLFILARNHTFNHLRKTALERVKQREWATHFESDQEPAPAALSEEFLPVVELAIQQLPPQQQKVYILKRQQGMKYDEIAAQLGISPETARKHLAAALRNITQYVQAHKRVVLLVLTTPLIIS